MTISAHQWLKRFESDFRVFSVFRGQQPPPFVSFVVFRGKQIRGFNSIHSSRFSPIAGVLTTDHTDEHGYQTVAEFLERLKTGNKVSSY